MFNVIEKATGRLFTVYAVENNNKDTPWFLMYIDGKWRWCHAGRFQPSTAPMGGTDDE